MRFAVVSLFALCSVFGAESDALSISANIRAAHMPFGTVVDPVYASPDSSDIAGYTRCGDSATWTGHYLAAEAYRYKVTADPDALDGVRRATAGLKSLVDVTGTDLLARCIVPMDSQYAAWITSEEAHNGVYISGQNFWIGHTSRDQYSGTFFGLAVAYDLVDDPDVRGTAQDLITRMLNFLLSNAWTVVMPDGTPSTTFIFRPDQQLALLQIGQHVNGTQFSATYKKLAGTAPWFVVPPVAYESQDQRDSYYKFNLDYINLFSLIRLEANSVRRAMYRDAYGFVRGATKSHENAFFNAIDRALNGPDDQRDAETIALLNSWLQRPPRDPWVDLRGVYASCVADDQACDPIPVEQRVPTDFLWQRSPFQLVGGGAGTIESAGIDYILPYWMSRYYQVPGI